MAKIPTFKSEREEADFWATHDLTDYMDELEEVKEPIELDPKLKKQIKKRSRKRLLTIRLDPKQIEEAKNIADERGIPYQTLIRSWIYAGIKKEKISLMHENQE
jgi:predicted DNA binding CopG/RHH family protein